MNKEITELMMELSAQLKLKPGGKILVVSFHSIEDRIIKYFFNNFSSNQSKPSRYIPEDIKEPVLFDDYKNRCLSHQ